MGKFKIGDTVRCVSENKTASCGYVPYKEFVVGYIRGDSDGRYVYFPEGGDGVYECDLILVETLPKTLPKSFACKNTNQVLWEKYISWLNTTYSKDLDGDSDVCRYYGISTNGRYEYHPSIDFYDTILSLEEWDEIVNPKTKQLPKSFACKNTNQVLWDKYIKWLDDGFAGDLSKYYGITRHGSSYNDNNMTMFDTILSLEEWDEIVNGTKTKEINMKKYTITRDQLKSIHDVACDAWKSKIQTYTLRNPFGNTFEFTQEEVGTMFKAATLDQTPVLEGIFGKQTREIDLSGGLVDGNVLFDNNRSLDNALMCVRLSGEYENKAFVLNNEYNWEIVDDGGDNPCLVPTRK